MKFSGKLRCVLALSLALGCGPGKSSNLPNEVLGETQAGVIEVDIAPDGSTVTEQIVANFLQVSSSQTCTITVSGACTLIDCPSGRAGVQPTNSGNITVANGGAKFTLFPESNNSGYQSAPVEPSAGMLFTPGSTFSVSSTGAFVPKFAASLEGPSPITVTAPANMTLEIIRSQDLTLSWSGSSAGNVIFQIEGLAPADNPIFECSFPVSAGSGTVPSAALELLATGNYEVGIFTRVRSVVAAGGWFVETNANYQGSTTGGVPFKPSAVLQ